MKRQYLSILSLLTLILSTGVYAAHVAPDFTGYWYLGVDYNGMDACGISSYNYRSKTQGDAATVGAQLLNDVTPHTDCEWQPAYQSSNMQNMPPDYPGNTDDWKAVLTDTNKPHVVMYRRECKTQQGRIIDSKNITILPSYQCPANSRQSFDLDSPNGVAGCTTTPASCKADVMGRDLNVPGFGELGHIALALPGFTSGMVMEVLKTPHEGIYTNSMDSFQHFQDNPYWGEKIGLPEKPLLGMTDANGIMSAATSQGAYPFEYTLTWDWHPGGMAAKYVLNQESRAFESVMATTSAKFRCDSFVYYTYLKGAGLHIVPDFSFPDVPKTLFDSFVECRNNRGTKCGAMGQPLTARAFLPEMSVESLLQKPDVAVEQMDRTMKDYLDNPGISRMSKINYLWALGQQYAGNENKYSYILDSLAYLRPVELVPDLIRAFNSANSVSTQRKIIATIISALSQDDINVLNSEINNVAQGQSFIRDVLLQNKNPEILKYVAQMYPSIVTPDQAEKDMALFYQRSDVPELNRLLSQRDRTLSRLRIVFATQQQQSRRLTGLLADNANDAVFKQSLCAVLSSVPAQWLAPDVKQPLRKFLESAKADFVNANKPDAPAFRWLNAYAVASVTDDSQKDDFILNYIRNETDAHARLNFLNTMPKSVYNRMPAAERMRYRSELRSQLSAQPAAAAQKADVLQALSRFAE